MYIYIYISMYRYVSASLNYNSHGTSVLYPSHFARVLWKLLGNDFTLVDFSHSNLDSPMFNKYVYMLCLEIVGSYDPLLSIVYRIAEGVDVTKQRSCSIDSAADPGGDGGIYPSTHPNIIDPFLTSTRIRILLLHA